MTLRQKKLGQNFLTDSKYVKIISNHIMALKPASILEIGSGTGIITKELCRICDHVISYEIDIDLFEKTSFNLSKFNNLNLVLGDGFNFKGDYDVFVSNLPYSKSRQFINWASGEKFRAAIVTVQKEFFDKITSNIGGKNYRAVTVLSNITFDIMPLEIIPNTSFYPPPKVQSQIILLTRKRIISDEIIKETEEDLPDKEQLRVAIEQNLGSAPDKAKLLRRVSLSYRRRKRIKKGV